MKYKISSLLLQIVFLSLILSLTIQAKSKRKSNKKPVKIIYEYSKPITHKNLSIILFKGESNPAFKDILTLEEVIKNKKVVIHETGNVNMLNIKNKSDKQVFIQSGDIIKGGKQDRVFQADLILKPKTRKTSVEVFCVEQGRWSRRNKESLDVFNDSSNSLKFK